MDDDFFKFTVAFIFSTIPATVVSTTETIGMRPLIVIFIPLLMYLLYKRQNSIRNIILIFSLTSFLFVTHHLIYFLIPTFFIFLTLHILFKYFKIELVIPEKVFPLIPIMFFLILFSIPFFLNKFLEGGSRYQFIVPDYVRYMGPFIVLSISGLVYLTFKQKKSFSEWFLLLSTISLITFIYLPTYMKWFIPIFLVPFACISLINIINTFQNKINVRNITIIFILISIIFTSFYQFIHVYDENPYNKRCIEDSTYNTGLWMKNSINGHAISNDRLFGFRIFSYSDTTHLLVPFTVINQVYGFIDADISLYERYPLSSEEFWFSGYKGPDLGEYMWESIQRMQKSPIVKIPT